MHHPSKKHLAEEFLLKAISNVSERYTETEPSEVRAPAKVYFYLAQAYHLDYKFDEALNMLASYSSFIDKKKFPNEIKLIEHKKQMSITAREKTKHPFAVEIQNVGNSINSQWSEISPLLLHGEKMIICTKAGPDATGTKDLNNDLFNEDIYISMKNKDGSWSSPKKISENINTAENERAVYVTPDARTIIIRRGAEGRGDLFYSNFDGNDWTVPVKFPSPINSEQDESGACFANDGNTIYFVSNRKGGFGGKDIYQSKNINEKWLPAENLGPVINTEYDEECPWMHVNGLNFYFSSEGHSSMGGLDVFFAALDTNGKFTSCTPMPYPINTTDDDDYFISSVSGNRSYYASAHEDLSGHGEQDIYAINLGEISSEENNRLAVFTGKITSLSKNDDITIFVYESISKQIAGLYKPKKDGSYILILEPNKTYFFSYQLNLHEFYTNTIHVDNEVTYEMIEKSIQLPDVNMVHPELNDSLKLNETIKNKSNSKNTISEFSRFRYVFKNNLYDFEDDSEINDFLAQIAKEFINKLEIKIKIIASSSNYPTNLKGGNTALAVKRYEITEKHIKKYLKSKVKTLKIKFVPETIISGPDYNPELKPNPESYTQFQYIEIHIIK